MKNSEAILVTPKHFEIQECPVPEPKDHEILMKVEYVGMCGSDIHGFEFGPFIPPKDPNQKIGLGHEVAGEVVKIGAKVTKFKVGVIPKNTKKQLKRTNPILYQVICRLRNSENCGKNSWLLLGKYSQNK